MPCYVTTNKPASREDYKLWCGMGYTRSYREYEAEKKRHEGARIFMCGENLELQNCADCTHVADYLCDYPVGDGKTCDRAMCDTHAHEIGPNLHYCDSHHAEWRRFVDAGGVSEHLKNVTAFKGA